MHMGSGFCLCAGADFLSARGVGGGGRFTDRRCRGRRPRRPAERSRPLPTLQKINGRQWQGCGPGMPGPYGVALFVRRGGFHIRPQACAAAEGLRIAAVGGRRPRRPAEVSGDGRYTGGMNPSPTDIPLTAVSREVAEGSRPLPTKQTVKGDSTVRLRAGHARPLQGIHDSHALASACATFPTSSSFRAEYPATTVSARQSSGRAR